MYLAKIFSIVLAVAIVNGQDNFGGYIFNCTSPAQIALTYDDGPAPFTPKLLGYLAAAKIPATFFVLGKSINTAGGKETLKAAYDAGHQIALHSNTHADMNTLSPQGIKDEYEINLKAVNDTIGVLPIMARYDYI